MRDILLLKEGNTCILKSVDGFFFVIDAGIIVGATYSQRGSPKSSLKDIFNGLMRDTEIEFSLSSDSGMRLVSSCIVTPDGNGK